MDFGVLINVTIHNMNGDAIATSNKRYSDDEFNAIAGTNNRVQDWSHDDIAKYCYSIMDIKEKIFIISFFKCDAMFDEQGYTVEQSGHMIESSCIVKNYETIYLTHMHKHVQF